jgi:hypothetical protein
VETALDMANSGNVPAGAKALADARLLAGL